MARGGGHMLSCWETAKAVDIHNDSSRARQLAPPTPPMHARTSRSTGVASLPQR